MAGPASPQAARELLIRATSQRVFPAAVAEVGDSQAVLWREPFGRLTFAEDAPPAEARTIFDLASLTKPIATTTAILDLVGRGVLGLTEPLGACFPEWRGDDRESATVRDLLEHAAGLAPRLLDPPPEGRREFEHDICTMPLAYPPRAQSVYGDLAFILLGFLVEDRAGQPLTQVFPSLAATSDRGHDRAGGDAFLRFSVPPDARAQTAPTVPLDDDLRRGRLLVGEVHDRYAAALGGSAGHAGLFGNVAGVGRFARAMLTAARGSSALPLPFTPSLVSLATTRSVVPGSSRALGWDTMRPTSSCGTGMSSAAFGHVGFTGTSLWLDPVLDRYFVLLTNRAGGGGTLEEMREVRRAYHDALVGLG
jgi:CubicO group peptidase (beta-lactamase class C family)